VGPVKVVTIREALQRVADYPKPLNDEWLQMPVHELVARSLFDIANSPDSKVRGANSRANKARKMILDRMAGRRRSGTKPVSTGAIDITFVDLTGGEISAPAEDVQPVDGGRHEPGITL
jgi:hypothetical protein